MAKQQLDPEIIEISKGLQGTPLCEEYEKMISGMLYVLIMVHAHLTYV